MELRQRGFTFIEVIAASVLTTLLAGGALMVVAVAAQVSRKSLNEVDATTYVQQTLERFRNKMTCRLPTEPPLGFPDFWFDDACNPVPIPPNSPDPLDADAIIMRYPNASRTFTVTGGADWDRDGKPDWYEIRVNVHWDQPE